MLTTGRIYGWSEALSIRSEELLRLASTDWFVGIATSGIRYWNLCTSGVVAAAKGQNAMNANNKKIATHTRAALALLFTLISLGVVSSGSVAKSPGVTYCLREVCHRVQTLDEVRAKMGWRKQSHVLLR